jgi:hypothetical protein
VAGLDCIASVDPLDGNITHCIPLHCASLFASNNISITSQLFLASLRVASHRIGQQNAIQFPFIVCHFHSIVHKKTMVVHRMADIVQRCRLRRLASVHRGRKSQSQVKISKYQNINISTYQHISFRYFCFSYPLSVCSPASRDGSTPVRACERTGRPLFLASDSRVALDRTALDCESVYSQALNDDARSRMPST